MGFDSGAAERREQGFVGVSELRFEIGDAEEVKNRGLLGAVDDVVVADDHAVPHDVPGSSELDHGGDIPVERSGADEVDISELPRLGEIEFEFERLTALGLQIAIDLLGAVLATTEEVGRIEFVLEAILKQGVADGAGCAFDADELQVFDVGFASSGRTGDGDLRADRQECAADWGDGRECFCTGHSLKNVCGRDVYAGRRFGEEGRLHVQM